MAARAFASCVRALGRQVVSDAWQPRSGAGAAPRALANALLAVASVTFVARSDAARVASHVGWRAFISILSATGKLASPRRLAMLLAPVHAELAPGAPHAHGWPSIASQEAAVATFRHMLLCCGAEAGAPASCAVAPAFASVCGPTLELLFATTRSKPHPPSARVAEAAAAAVADAVDGAHPACRPALAAHALPFLESAPPSAWDPHRGGAFRVAAAVCEGLRSLAVSDAEAALSCLARCIGALAAHAARAPAHTPAPADGEEAGGGGAGGGRVPASPEVTSSHAGGGSLGAAAALLGLISRSVTGDAQATHCDHAAALFDAAASLAATLSAAPGGGADTPLARALVASASRVAGSKTAEGRPPRSLLAAVCSAVAAAFPEEADGVRAWSVADGVAAGAAGALLTSVGGAGATHAPHASADAPPAAPPDAAALACVERALAAAVAASRFVGGDTQDGSAQGGGADAIAAAAAAAGAAAARLRALLPAASPLLPMPRSPRAADAPQSFFGAVVGGGGAAHPPPLHAFASPPRASAGAEPAAFAAPPPPGVGAAPRRRRRRASGVCEESQPYAVIAPLPKRAAASQPATEHQVEAAAAQRRSGFYGAAGAGAGAASQDGSLFAAALARAGAPVFTRADPIGPTGFAGLIRGGHHGGSAGEGVGVQPAPLATAALGAHPAPPAPAALPPPLVAAPAPARKVSFAPPPAPSATQEGAAALSFLSASAAEAAAASPLCAPLVTTPSPPPLSSLLAGLPKGCRQQLESIGVTTTRLLAGMRRDSLDLWPRDAAAVLRARLSAAADALQPPTEALVLQAEACASPPAAPPVGASAVGSPPGAWLTRELTRLACAPQWAGIESRGAEPAAAHQSPAALHAAQGVLLGLSVRLHSALARSESRHAE